MQFHPPIKDSLALIFALLYLLGPLNEVILEISHSVSHKISEKFSVHDRDQTHTHAHSHTDAHAHTHANITSAEPEKHEQHVHVEKHSHHILEFISSAFNSSDEEQLPVEKTEKKNYDKHLLEYYSQFHHFNDIDRNTCLAYLLRDHNSFLKDFSPPPENNFHRF